MSIILQKYVQAYHTVFFHIKAKSKKIIQIKRKVSEFIIDETLLKVGENYVWLWIAIEPIDKIVLGILDFYPEYRRCNS